MQGKQEIKPLYLAKTKDEFEFLEKRTAELFEHYGIDCIGDYSISLIIFQGETEMIKIAPVGAGTIREIYPISDKPLGRFFRCTPEGAMLDLEDVRYLIKFKPGNQNVLHS